MPATLATGGNPDAHTHRNVTKQDTYFSIDTYPLCVHHDGSIHSVYIHSVKQSALRPFTDDIAVNGSKPSRSM